MLGKLKPLPKALLVAVVIAAIGYGVSVVLPKSKPTEVKYEAPQTSVKKIDAAPEPEPVVIPEVEQARNAGLDKLLNSGTK